MKYLIIALLLSASASAQKIELEIDYKATGLRYDTVVRAVRYSEKDYTNRPERIIMNKAEKYIHIVYKHNTVKYSVDTSISISFATVGAGAIRFICSKQGVKDKYEFYWVFYERSKDDTFFEFVIEAPDYIEKYNVKID